MSENYAGTNGRRLFFYPLFCHQNTSAVVRYYLSVTLRARKTQRHYTTSHSANSIARR